MSAGYSVRWLSNGCPRTGEWTLLTAHMRRLQVKKQNKIFRLKIDFSVLNQIEKEHEVQHEVFLFCLDLSLSLLSCRQYCVTQIATRPGRISAQEDFLPSQLEHLHIAQFKGQD